MEVNGKLHAPASLPPRNCTRYPLKRWLGGPQSQSGRSEEGRNLLALLGIEPDRPALVTIPTELSRLVNICVKFKNITYFSTPLSWLLTTNIAVKGRSVYCEKTCYDDHKRWVGKDLEGFDRGQSINMAFGWAIWVNPWNHQSELPVTDFSQPIHCRS
jgi:hypothetical protein